MKWTVNRLVSALLVMAGIEVFAAEKSTHRGSIRESARQSLALLGATEIPVVQPEIVSSRWLDRELTQVRGLVIRPIPPEATWCQFEIPPTDSLFSLTKSVTNFCGWVLADKGGRVDVLTWFGTELRLSKSQIRYSRVNLADSARTIANLYSDASEDGDERLQQIWPGGLAAIPIALVAAWCHERGERLAAVDLILPRIGETNEDRWLFSQAREKISYLYREKMHSAFVFWRNYSEAVRYANHLSAANFNGSIDQERARELAVQLSKRSDDFKSFKLPTTNQWRRLQKSTTREAQIRYLAERLRLLNCVQWDNPGTVRFLDKQNARAVGDDIKKWEKAAGTINPFAELLLMNLKVTEIPLLAPYLADEDFMPTMSFFSSGAGDLHRVKEAAARLINHFAKRKIANLEATNQTKQIVDIMRWCQENADKTYEQLILGALRNAEDQYEFEWYAIEALREKVPGVNQEILRCAERFPNYEGLPGLAYYADSEEFILPAHAWLQNTNRYVRFWSSLILLRLGNRQLQEGWPELKAILQEDKELEYLKYATPALLSLPGGEGTQLVFDRLGQAHPDRRWNSDCVLHQCFYRGKKEALEFMLSQLDDPDRTKMSRMARGIQDMRSDGWEHVDDPTTDKGWEKSRNQLKTFLRTQFKLIEAGKKNAIRPAPQLYSDPGLTVGIYYVPRY